MKRIFFIVTSLLLLLGISSCQKTKPTRCSFFSNEDYSAKVGPVSLEIDYSFSINAKVSISTTDDVQNPVTLAIDGVVVDSIDTFPWSKKFQINFMHIGQHYFTLTYNDGFQENSLVSEFWVCNRPY